jgi:hypothetical protein
MHAALRAAAPLLMRLAVARVPLTAAARCRPDVEKLAEKYGLVRFMDSRNDGFTFDDTFQLRWPPQYDHLVSSAGAGAAVARPSSAGPALHLPPQHGYPINPAGSYVPIAVDNLSEDHPAFVPGAFSGTAREAVMATLETKPLVERRRHNDSWARSSSGNGAGGKGTGGNATGGNGTGGNGTGGNGAGTAQELDRQPVGTGTLM